MKLNDLKRDHYYVYRSFLSDTLFKYDSYSIGKFVNFETGVTILTCKIFFSKGIKRLFGLLYNPEDSSLDIEIQHQSDEIQDIFPITVKEYYKMIRKYNYESKKS